MYINTQAPIYIQIISNDKDYQRIHKQIQELNNLLLQYQDIILEDGKSLINIMDYDYDAKNFIFDHNHHPSALEQKYLDILNQKLQDINKQINKYNISHSKISNINLHIATSVHTNVDDDSITMFITNITASLENKYSLQKEQEQERKDRLERGCSLPPVFDNPLYATPKKEKPAQKRKNNKYNPKPSQKPDPNRYKRCLF